MYGNGDDSSLPLFKYGPRALRYDPPDNGEAPNEYCGMMLEPRGVIIPEGDKEKNGEDAALVCLLVV